MRIRCRHIPRTEFVADYLAGESLRSLRQRYQVCIHRLRRILEKQGIERRDRESGYRRMRELWQHQHQDAAIGRLPASAAIQAYQDGTMLRALAEQCGLSSVQVSRRLRACGVQIRSARDESSRWQRERAKASRKRAKKGS